MSLKVIAVNGAPTAGKTTFEWMVQDIRHKKGLQTEIWSVVEPIKELAYKHFGVGGYDAWGEAKEKTPKMRRFYSDLKDMLDRYCEHTKNCCKIEIEKYRIEASSKDILLFIDAREPKDLRMLKDTYNATTICIRRASAENLETSNHADAEVLNFKYDIEIWNNGDLDDFRELAKEFCEQMKEVKPYEFN